MLPEDSVSYGVVPGYTLTCSMSGLSTLIELVKKELAGWHITSTMAKMVSWPVHLAMCVINAPYLPSKINLRGGHQNILIDLPAKGSSDHVSL